MSASFWLTAAAVGSLVTYAPADLGPFPDGVWECRYKTFKTCVGDKCEVSSLRTAIVLDPRHLTYSRCQQTRCMPYRAVLDSADNQTSFLAYQFAGETLVAHVFDDLSFAELSEDGEVRTTGEGSCVDVTPLPPIYMPIEADAKYRD